MNPEVRPGRKIRGRSPARRTVIPSGGALVFMLFFIVAELCVTFPGFGVDRVDSEGKAPSLEITLHDWEEEAPIRVYEVVSELIREVTAYNVGIHEQTDSEPCIGASGDDLCKLLELGQRICATNSLPLGTILRIQNYGECVVMDRMNRRYKHRIDIAMSPGDVGRARKFGIQKLQVSVLAKID